MYEKAFNKDYEMDEAIPYKGAKPMYLVDSDDPEMIKYIVLDTYKDLKN